MAAACPWVVGQWTPEDCECGVWQSRTVSCAATGRVGEALSEDMCAQWAPKPQDERPCGCWEPSDWEECSCSGVQSRTVSCTGSSCAEPAPAVEQTCDPICEWEVGVWSACVGACGSGERTRTVRCPEDGACAGLPVPDVEECEAPCDWITGPWESCTAVCGGATRSRSVTCPAQSASSCGPSSDPP